MSRFFIVDANKTNRADKTRKGLLVYIDDGLWEGMKLRCVRERKKDVIMEAIEEWG